MEALEIAINMENDGKSFYETAGAKASDNLGRELFARLAKEEDFHAAKAREIHEALKKKETPMAIEESLDRGSTIRSIFAKARKELEARGEASASEMEAIDMAMQMEEKSIKFYEEQAGASRNEFEKRYFAALKGEERGHYLSLVDYKEYLTDPADWFTKSEHHSLDGG